MVLRAGWLVKVGLFHLGRSNSERSSLHGSSLSESNGKASFFTTTYFPFLLPYHQFTTLFNYLVLLLYVGGHPFILTSKQVFLMPLAPVVFSCANFSRPLLMPKTFWTEAGLQRLSRWQESSFPRRESVFLPKSLRHRRTAHPAPKNNFPGQGQTARKQGKNKTFSL